MIRKLLMNDFFNTQHNIQSRQSIEFLRLHSFFITALQTNLLQQTLLMNRSYSYSVKGHISSSCLPQRKLQLTALVATLYPLPLFIFKGSSAHSRLIRIITPPLLVFIIQFPSSLLLSAIHCQSGIL